MHETEPATLMTLAEITQRLRKEGGGTFRIRDAVIFNSLPKNSILIIPSKGDSLGRSILKVRLLDEPHRGVRKMIIEEKRRIERYGDDEVGLEQPDKIDTHEVGKIFSAYFVSNTYYFASMPE